MDIENRRRDRKVRIKGKGLAVVSSGETAMEYSDWNLRKQVCRTLGFPRDFENPDIELLYRFSTEEYCHPLLGYIHKQLVAGKRFKAGDSFKYRFEPSHKDYTVEFRKTADENLLRAVVLELDMQYQLLSEEEAIQHCKTVALHEEELYGSYEVDDDLLSELASYSEGKKDK